MTKVFKFCFRRFLSTVIKMKSASKFSEGLAEVRKGNQKMYIDMTEKEVILLEVDLHFRFSDRLALFIIGQKYG